MDNMTAQLAEQLKRNPAMLQSLMQSKDGQRLIQMLTQRDHGADLKKAVQAASTGDTTRMVQMVQQIMQSPEGAALAERINRAVQNR